MTHIAHAALAAPGMTSEKRRMKTSELIGPALDWAVSLITNPEWSDEDRRWNTCDYADVGDEDDEPYSPSTNWAQGGPIIEREGMCIGTGSGVYASTWYANKGLCVHHQFGPTPLTAAMRCYVASKLGEEVELPEELR